MNLGLPALALGVCVSALGQSPVISSFSQNGELVCTNLLPGTVASVEWASSVAGPWTNNWVGLDAVQVGSNGTIQVSVPMFYRVRGTPSPPPVSNPQIGYVNFPPPYFTSEFHPVSSGVFNNDYLIVIVKSAPSQGFYEFAETLDLAEVFDPTVSSPSVPAGYQDGLYLRDVVDLSVASVFPKLSIKAMSKQSGYRDSAVVTAQFQFVVANPIITGNDANQFTIGDITDHSALWYTTDGTTPTNTTPSQFAGTIIGANAITLSLSFPPGVTNLTFKVRGFKNNYQPSGVVSKLFTTN